MITVLINYIVSSGSFDESLAFRIVFFWSEEFKSPIFVRRWWYRIAGFGFAIFFKS
jgi:hypothetical protein